MSNAEKFLRLGLIMKRPPELYLADEITYFPDTEIKSVGGNYFVARPYIPLSTSFQKRLRLAFFVFMGKYDVIYFKGGEPEEEGLIRREREARIDAQNKKKKFTK
jgi:hypothetical protein